MDNPQKIALEFPINNSKIDILNLHKMAFLYNALENGWTIKKTVDRYVFTQKHGGKKEIYLDTYLKTFLKENMTINNLLTTE